VRDQVLALRKAPFAEKVFGAPGQRSGHGFRLDPLLREDEVAEAEEELGVAFPSGYRTFLLEVGAGGAGPDYGVFPLRRDEQGWHWAADGGGRRVDAHRARPFPSMAERAGWAEELAAREPQEQDFPDQQAYRDAFHRWDQEWDVMAAGAVCLGHQGCGYYTWLAVTGPDSGTLWHDLRAVDGLFEPVTSGPDRVDFHGWYRDWLNRATAEAHGA
jgi:hypothetical protein